MEARSGSRPAAEVVLAVWEAEDGRCEACKRPMDKSVARVARVDDHGPRNIENLQLLCVDCKAHRPDPLARLTLAGSVAERVVGALGPEQSEQAIRWLRGQLQRHGVLVGVRGAQRLYWLPGVATFQVAVQSDGPAAVESIDRISATPLVKVKPQERTRGLPRPNRRPLSAPV